MSKYRQAARIDENQPEIVNQLRQLGCSVQTGMDDILVGYRGKTYWFELKDPEKAVSKKTGEILDSQIKPSQVRLKNQWRGHYSIVHSIEQIMNEIRTADEDRDNP